MKVLWISNWKESSGYSQASRDWILAADEVGLDIVPRALTITGSKAEVPNRILELEKKSAFGATHVIYHTLPTYISYQFGLENICVCAIETDSIKDTGWVSKLNLMDKVWSISKQGLETFKNSGVTAKLGLLPHATDVRKYQQDYEKINLPILKDIFVFGFVGEFNRRKNLASIVKAFHSEFSANDRVMLLIKSHIPGQSPHKSAEQINQFTQEIKRGLKLYKDESQYRPELVVTDTLSELDMLRLYGSIDALVCASYGEAWCLPAMDAMGMGKAVISNRISGVTDFLTEDIGYLCDNTLEGCFGVMDSLPNLYSTRQNWWDISVEDLKKKMRLCYENKELRHKKAELGINQAYNFSYGMVGQIMKGLLDG